MQMYYLFKITYSLNDVCGKWQTSVETVSGQTTVLVMKNLGGTKKTKSITVTVKVINIKDKTKQY